MTRGYGFRINFSVPELSQTLNQISAYDGKTAMKIENVVQKSTHNIRDGAKQRVPVRSGDLKKSISARFDSRTITGYVAARKPYAHLVEFGAKGGTVKPKIKKALTVPGSETGFATRAKIPQRREHPFMRPAFENEKANLIKGLKEAVKP